MNEAFYPKTVAFYLPQFHCIPENDEWWGEGFTEWVNVKKARPLYNKHYQPKIPLNNNYYNLLNPDTLRWQAGLMNKYHIDILCFYHYWFDGRMLLEKPAELLLNNKDISMPFFFCWANEPWSRSWNGSRKSIIMPQNYGNKEDWIKHFKYLLPFFKDERYTKINNCPVLVLYRTSSIPQCDDMVRIWNDLCKMNGFDGIYIIEELNGFQNKSHCTESKAMLEFEPTFTLYGEHKPYLVLWIKKCFYAFCNKFVTAKTRYYNYDYLWKKIIKRKYRGKKVFSGAFVDWDNTARRGKTALIVKGYHADKFKKYLKYQYQRAFLEKSEFLFINAWNEWGEGAYLEPDTNDDFHRLEAVKSVVDLFRSENPVD